MADEDRTASEDATIEEPEAQVAAEPEAQASTGESPGEEVTTAVRPAGAPAAKAEAGAAEKPGEVGAKARRSKKRLPRSERRQRPRVKRERPAERNPIIRLPKPEHERGRRQERRGVVVSSAMDKTIVVKVDTVKAHPRYKKVVRRSRKFHAHDEQNSAKVGDMVRIVETRPLSKLKNWRLAEIVEAAR